MAAVLDVERRNGEDRLRRHDIQLWARRQLLQRDGWEPELRVLYRGRLFVGADR